MEIGSPSTATTDLVRKRELYAEIGVGEYWRFDSTGGNFYREPLAGERLVEGEYRRLEMEHRPDGTVRGHSEVLGLDLCWEDGHLRFYDPATDRWLPNHWDVYARSDAEQAARESAEALVDAERVARESAEARLAEMEAELRRLRGE